MGALEGSLFAALLGEELSLDVGENTTLRDGAGDHEFVELIIVAEGELHVAWLDLLLASFLGSISSEFENLTSEVLKHGGGECSGASTDSVSVSALSEILVASCDGEDDSCSCGACSLFLARAGCFSFSCHFEVQSQLSEVVCVV